MALPFYVYDLLESESQVRWGADQPVGTPITLTYSFPGSEPSGSNYPGYTPFTSVEMTAARNAFSYISSITNISFVETTSTTADFRFGNADLTGIGASVSGRTDYSYDSSGLTYANIHIANTGQASQAASDFQPGSISSNDIGGQGWGTLIHELGHALGLKHPFETNAAGDPNSVLPSSLDHKVNSVMSYTNFEPSEVAVVTGTAQSYSYRSASLQPQGFSLYDIAALQYLYGSGPAAGSNKTYTFAPDVPVFETIFDNGPKATIDCSALTGPCRIDMNPGARSDLAIQQSLPFGLTISNQYNGTSALTIAYGCMIARCIGGSGDDNITGNAANNVIIGKGGSDTMSGLGGNDLYYVDRATDIVNEAAGAGYDTIFTTLSYALQAGSSVDVLETTSTVGTPPINLTGNELANTLLGNAAANRLDGGGGIDKLHGYGGNDTYVVDNSHDLVYEVANAGTDTVDTAVSYKLLAGSAVETLQTADAAGTVALNLTGNEFVNTLRGNAGVNKLDGGGGIDKMYGLGGNDVYFVDTTSDATYEAANQGTDTVLTSVSYVLKASQSIEKLYTSDSSGTGALKLTGNALAQTIVGNAGGNRIDGKDGNDILTGGAANDTFVYDTALNGKTNVDRITDFAVHADVIELSHAIFTALGAGALSSDAFYVGAAAHDASDRIIYDGSTGALSYDTNGSAAGGATRFGTLSTGLALTAGDFRVA